MKLQFPADFGMRLLALLLAVALWFVTAEDTRNRRQVVEERAVPAPVRMVGLAKDLVSVADVGPVEVRLQVPTGVTIPDRLEALADLSGLKAGDHSVPVRISVPPRFTVLAVKPERVRVHLEREISRSLPVEVAVLAMPTGTGVAVQAAEPATVTVVGAESRMQRVARILAVATYDPEAPGVQAPVQPVDLRGSNVSGITVSPRQVFVTFEETGEPAAGDEALREGQDLEVSPLDQEAQP